MPIIWGWTIQGCTSEWRLVWSDKHRSSSPWPKLIPMCVELSCEELTRISFSVFLSVRWTFSKGIKGADKDLLQCLSECALNILKGNITLKPAEKSRLTKYRQKLCEIADKKVSLKQKHKIVQTGGFAPALLAPLLGPVIAPLAKWVIGGLLGGKIWNHGQGDAIGRPKDVAADVNSIKSCSPYHTHLRSGHASCAGQARSQGFRQEMPHQTKQSKKSLASSLINGNTKRKLFWRGSNINQTRVGMSVVNLCTMEMLSKEVT